MGQNKSKTVSDIVNETTAQVIMQSMQSCMSQSSQTQTISGSFAFGVSQTANNVMDVSCASHFNMTNDLALSIASQIQQKAQAQGVALLDTLHMNTAQATSTIANKISANITSSLVQKTIANTAQSQSILNSVAIGSTQTLDSSTTLKALTQMTANTGIGVDIQNSTSQSTSATQTNPLSFLTSSLYILLAVVFLVILIIGGLIYLVIG